MKIAIASDLSGFPLKEAIVKHLRENKYDVTDFGIPNENESLPYYIQAPKVAKAIQKGEAERGILICGTGQGMAIVANKHKGIYACVANDLFAGERGKIVNDANVITLGGWITAPFLGCEIVDAWLAMSFCQKMEFKREWLTSAYHEVQKLEDANFK
ncbi:MAG: RpiB/LacA/LacB family sugar-phosphate isomerase [Treponema sp.]|nr:RpiB/LacA/LacB family sugar-phosphate isomerase [Treponema sp.]